MVVKLFSAWEQAIHFDTSTLVVREIDTHDAIPFLNFVNNNLQEIERISPTYACGEELDTGRIISHILDWKHERVKSGNATLVCYAKDDTRQKNLVATMNVDGGLDLEMPIEVGVFRDKAYRETGIASEALDSLAVKIAFNRLKAKAVRSYPEWDDRDGCKIAEGAGFSFLGNQIRPMPFFDIELPRNYAVYERTPS